jgi:hypothetical protein
MRARWVTVRLVGIVPVLALFAQVGSAKGEEADPKAIAKGKLIEGGDLLREGDARSALQRFKEAYDLVASPKIFYNFGLAYRGMGKTTAAIEAFEKFLADAPDADPDRRSDAEHQKEVLLPQIGSVVVSCDTDGAEISVDGQSYGVTPLKGAIRLDPGPHQLVIEESGVAHFTQKLTTEPGQQVAVMAALRPTVVAPVAVQAAPAPAVVGTAPKPIEPPAPPRNWTTIAAWSVGGAAVLALAFGVVNRLSANSKAESFNSYAAPDNALGKCDSAVVGRGGPMCASLLDDSNAAASRAVIGFVGGAILGAGAAALFVVSHRRVEGETHAHVSSLACTPNLGRPGNLGVACGLHF